MSETQKGRGVGIIIKNNKILLIRRIKDERKYFVFPGGGIEDGETPEEATIREVQEELSLNVKIDKLLFKLYNPGTPGFKLSARDDYFFLITDFSGEVKLGGGELDRMDESDQFYLEWHDLKEAEKLKNLFPEEAKKKLFAIFEDWTQKILV